MLIKGLISLFSLWLSGDLVSEWGGSGERYPLEQKIILKWNHLFFPFTLVQFQSGSSLQSLSYSSFIKNNNSKKGSRLILTTDPGGSTYMGKRGCFPMLVLISMYKPLLTDSSPHCSQCKMNHSLYDCSFKSDPKPLVQERKKAWKERPAAGNHVRYLLSWAVPWLSSKSKKLSVLKIGDAAATTTFWH